MENGDYADAAIDGISDPHIGFVSERIDGVFAIFVGNFFEEFGDVAGAEDAVDADEFLGLIGEEVRGEDAIGLAFPAEEFTGGARRGGGGAGGRGARGRRRRGRREGRGRSERRHIYIYIYIYSWIQMLAEIKEIAELIKV
ncbi:hypothetical protein IEQ34_008861 [Dendrobium chrysotoxum]|uniref:Uncharacterized protein n=1 Tax=Dendrobium chrysotoxum TaxID=161865 RepID=A0AAV7GYX1_DENCH|nr:hypothetical protein IEQ34_008861 [Dendrobium chrysotoxum]